MTTSFDASHYQRILERWRVLAEQRLEHMTLLYETGRWRRYFSEEKFVGAIRETRTAVETWRRLAPDEAIVSQLFVPPDEPPVTTMTQPASTGRTQPPPSPFTATMEQRRSVA